MSARPSRPTIFERSGPGGGSTRVPALDVPEHDPAGSIPATLLRSEPPGLPEVSEPEAVRHYTELSTRNFGVDSGFYPLGSCTMKHNPKVNERVAALPGFQHLHPHQEPEFAQGALEVMWHLQQLLGEIVGLRHVTLQPAAGAQGELTGLLLVRAFHMDRGEARHKVIIPDTAHGTNAATVTMAGYETVSVTTTATGGMDLEDLTSKLDDDVACLMLTNPNTLGVFDPNIETIAAMFHERGALLYYDGANLNPIMGICRPGDMGFDVVHLNLHKSFSTPHGGGGPGAGPVAVGDRLAPYLPIPTVERLEGAEVEFALDHDRPKTIGPVMGRYGNFGVLLRAYTYIVSLGRDGLKDAAEQAVLNANYLLARLDERFDVPYGDRCMHEFVASGRRFKEKTGVKVMDIAKRMLDYGVHPPTVYFPLLVPEAVMIEPTETESKERLDGFVDLLTAILDEAERDPGFVQGAPYSTPVGRLDEAQAARNRILRGEPPA